jgi:hypothetical protein
MALMRLWPELRGISAGHNMLSANSNVSEQYAAQDSLYHPPSGLGRPLPVSFLSLCRYRTWARANIHGTWTDWHNFWRLDLLRWGERLGLRAGWLCDRGRRPAECSDDPQNENGYSSFGLHQTRSSKHGRRIGCTSYRSIMNRFVASEQFREERLGCST